MTTPETKTGIKGSTEVQKNIPGMLSTAERTTLKKAVTSGYDTALKAATIYEDAIKGVYLAHSKDPSIKEPADIKKLILKATRQLLGIKNEKEETEPARKYRAFARFCNQSFSWSDNRKKTAIEFKAEADAKKKPAGTGEPKTKANKKSMTFDELKALIHKAEPSTLNMVLGLFKISYLVEYVEKQRAIHAAKKNTVEVKTNVK